MDVHPLINCIYRYWSIAILGWLNHTIHRAGLAAQFLLRLPLASCHLATLRIKEGNGTPSCTILSSQCLKGGTCFLENRFLSWQCVKTLSPFRSHQNSWDLWMFIPLKMVCIGIDPYPVGSLAMLTWDTLAMWVWLSTTGDLWRHQGFRFQESKRPQICSPMPWLKIHGLLVHCTAEKKQTIRFTLWSFIYGNKSMAIKV